MLCYKLYEPGAENHELRFISDKSVTYSSLETIVEIFLQSSFVISL